MEPLTEPPAWLLRTLPANAVADEALHARLDGLAAKLPDSIGQIHAVLSDVRMYREYDAAADHACAHVWRKLEQFYSEPPATRALLLAFAAEHMAGQPQARIIRRLVKDPAITVRRKAARLIERADIREVALPQGRTGDWDTRGWLQGVVEAP